jgi:hypothetical protein
MADDIIQFAPGGKVTAEETNENNLLLKEWALDNSQSEAYIDGKIATLTTNLNSQISSLNSQLATKAPLSNPTLTGTVKVPNNAAVGTAIATAAISKAASGYLKMGNGIIIQWGSKALTSWTATTITLPTPFTSTNYKVASGVFTSNENGNEQNWIRITNIKTSSFSFTKPDGGTAHWLAIGY